MFADIMTSRGTYYTGIVGTGSLPIKRRFLGELGEDGAIFSLNIEGDYGFSFNENAYYTIPAKSSVSLIVDPYGYGGKSYDFFTMWIVGLTNSEFLKFYCSVVDRATGNIIIPRTKLDVYRSLQHPQQALTEKGQVRLPFDLNAVKYIYEVENIGSKPALIRTFWKGGNNFPITIMGKEVYFTRKDILGVQVPAEQIQILPTPAAQIASSISPFGPWGVEPVSVAATTLFSPLTGQAQVSPEQVTGGILEAGFDFGSNWPILAVIGIGAMLIFRGSGKQKGSGKRRSKKRKRSRR